ncbi:hypothetical protein C366_00383 [Cryptococcus neoformans Tu401-1]|nr:hypothetical protein C366_00383 [Cryptococcus neoformans var. grubii Tu401-1]
MAKKPTERCKQPPDMYEKENRSKQEGTHKASSSSPIYSSYKVQKPSVANDCNTLDHPGFGEYGDVQCVTDLGKVCSLWLNVLLG